VRLPQPKMQWCNGRLSKARAARPHCRDPRAAHAYGGRSDRASGPRARARARRERERGGSGGPLVLVRTRGREEKKVEEEDAHTQCSSTPDVGSDRKHARYKVPPASLSIPARGGKGRTAVARRRGRRRGKGRPHSTKFPPSLKSPVAFSLFLTLTAAPRAGRTAGRLAAKRRAILIERVLVAEEERKKKKCCECEGGE
jgi:hypothetical protein